MHKSSSDCGVTVLMATYNGEQYLTEQVESLYSQTYGNWCLLVRDDGSTDATPTLLKKFSERDGRVEILDTGPQRLGPARSFGVLISEAVVRDLPYVAFSDQDDVWDPDKLAVQMATMKRIEARDGPDTPILICSDLEVVTEDLRSTHNSFMQYQGIRDPQKPSLATLVFQNHVVGCTILANRALLRLANPQPDSAYMHDWWLALCASASGVIEMLADPLVRYRQHGRNQVGAGGFGRIYRPIRWYGLVKKINRLFVFSIRQARALQERLAERGRAPREAWTETFLQHLARIPAESLFQRLNFLRSNRVVCQNVPLTLLLYFQMSWPPLIKRVRL